MKLAVLIWHVCFILNAVGVYTVNRMPALGERCFQSNGIYMWGCFDNPVPNVPPQSYWFQCTKNVKDEWVYDFIGDDCLYGCNENYDGTSNTYRCKTE
eukprot:Pgem_evm1s8322